MNETSHSFFGRTDVRVSDCRCVCVGAVERDFLVARRETMAWAVGLIFSPHCAPRGGVAAPRALVVEKGGRVLVRRTTPAETTREYVVARRGRNMRGARREAMAGATGLI